MGLALTQGLLKRLTFQLFHKGGIKHCLGGEDGACGGAWGLQKQRQDALEGSVGEMIPERAGGARL